MEKCFHVALGLGLAAAALRAATPAAPPRQMTSVVRTDVRTGRLVRTVAVAPRVIAPAVLAPADPSRQTPAPAAATTAANLSEAVEQVASQNALPSSLVHSVIQVESNYNPWAISSKGALGLMQLIPSTARRFGVKDAFNPLENLKGGARYLRYLLDLYGEKNYHLALAAYNAGEGAVARYGGVPPYAETRNYLVLVGQALEIARKSAPAAKPKAAEPAHQTVEVKPVEVHNRIEEIVESDGRVRYVSR
jgi:soluble lytic murein transglycosylase-like protein